MRLVPLTFRSLAFRVLPLAAAFFAMAADGGGCTIIVNDDDDDEGDEDCDDLGDICPNLSCENGNVLDSDGCPICECNTTACDVDDAGPPPECADARFDEQTCSWTCGSNQECFSDADCGFGFVCALTDCAGGGAGEEGDAIDCGNGGGVCIQINTNECFTDSDCGFGFRCDFSGGGGAGEAPPDRPDECADNDGDGLCDQQDVPAPPPNGQCVPTAETCITDSDCPANFTCAFPDNAGGIVAIEGVCVETGPVACTVNEDCRDGQHCEFLDAAGGLVINAEGVCVDDAPVECSDDSACDRGQVCVIDGCAGGGDSNSPDPDGDQACFPIGHCEDVGPAPCFADGDCREGEFCALVGEDGGANRPAPCVDENGNPCDADIAPPPPPAGVCLPLPVDDSCADDADCGEGQACLIADDCVCDASCQDDGNGGCLPCVCAGVCVDVTVSCFSDAECSPDEQCVIGGNDIAPPPDCDPASGEACRPAPPAGTCQPRERTDDCGNTCTDAQVCVVDADGTASCADLGSDCTSTADCADGFLCTAETQNDCRPDPTCDPNGVCDDVCHGVCFDPRDG